MSKSETIVHFFEYKSKNTLMLIETWSIHGILQEKKFSAKIMRKIFRILQRRKIISSRLTYFFDNGLWLQIEY